MLEYTYVSVGWILIHWSVKVDIFFVGDLRVSQVGQGHLVHNIENKALNRYVHILRQMDLVKLVEHLLEAFEEREATQNADGLLRPNLIVVFVLRVLQLAFETARALLIEY